MVIKSIGSFLFHVQPGASGGQLSSVDRFRVRVFKNLLIFEPVEVKPKHVKELSNSRVTR